MSADRGIRPGRCVVVAVPAASGTSLFHQLLGYPDGTVGTDNGFVVAVSSVHCHRIGFETAPPIVVVARDAHRCRSDVRLVEEHESGWRKEALYGSIYADVNRSVYRSIDVCGVVTSGTGGLLLLLAYNKVDTSREAIQDWSWVEFTLFVLSIERRFIALSLSLSHTHSIYLVYFWMHVYICILCMFPHTIILLREQPSLLLVSRKGRLGLMAGRAFVGSFLFSHIVLVLASLVDCTGCGRHGRHRFGGKA